MRQPGMASVGSRGELVTWRCELGECGRQAELRCDVGGEFEVAAAEVLDEGVSGDDYFGGSGACESPHRPQPGL